MWGFYWRVVKGVPSAIWDTSDRFFLTLEILLAAGILFPGAADIFRRKLTPNLYWVTVGCSVALVGLAVIRSINREAKSLEDRALTAETELAAEQRRLRAYQRERDEASPNISFGSPVSCPREEVIITELAPAGPYTSTSSGPLKPLPVATHRVTLWRIHIRNGGAHAPDVRVKLVRIEPATDFAGMLPVTLHRKDDNPADRESYQESFPLGTAEPVVIDVLGMTEAPPYTCFLYKTGSRDHVQEVRIDAGVLYWLTIAAFAGNTYTVAEYHVLTQDFETGLQLDGPFPEGTSRKRD